MNFENYVQNLLIGFFGGLISGMVFISYDAFSQPNTPSFISFINAILIPLIVFLLICPFGWWIIKKMNK